MTGTIKKNKYGIHEADHTKFGGVVCLSDFNTDNRGKNNTNGSPIAIRIEKDKQLDKQWRKNREGMERKKQYGK